MLAIIIYLFFEKSGLSSKKIALISGLSALGGLGRVPFAGIPSVQPTTFIVMVSGWVLGPYAGFAVGVLSTFVSNIFLGQGPWTPWQMVAWGLAGATSGALGKLFNKKKFPKIQFTVLCVLWGYFFGLIMNFWMWYAYVPSHDIIGYFALWSTSIWFDTMHAMGNGIFSFMFAEEFAQMISRFRDKMLITFEEVRETET